MKSFEKAIVSLHFLLLTILAIAQPNETGKIKHITNVIDCYPMLSKDSSKLVFQSNRTGNWEIFVSDTNGSNLRQLTNNDVPDVTPCWSPDGKKIVFASGMDNTSDIFIMNADGSNRKQLTNVDGDDSHPHFSADGKQIVFNSPRTTADLSIDWSKQWHEIYIMDSDGSNQKQLTHLKTVCTFPNLSPDGRKIVFRRVIADSGMNWDLSKSQRNSEVFIFDRDDESVVNISNSPAFDGWPCWSPDGKNILFASNRNGPANVGQLYIYNLGTKTIVQATQGPLSHVQPSYSADGLHILAYELVETEDYEHGGIIMMRIK